MNGKKITVPAIVENKPHRFKQFATVCRHPICKRSAIQSNVITVSRLNRAAIFALTASVLRRSSKSCSAQDGEVEDDRLSSRTADAHADKTAGGRGNWRVG